VDLPEEGDRLLTKTLGVLALNKAWMAGTKSGVGIIEGELVALGVGELEGELVVLGRC